MRIAHLSLSSNPFIVRWVNSQVEEGHEVHYLMHQPESDPMKDAVNSHLLCFGKPWGYYLNARYLRGLLAKIKPDVLHVHYATGNGTLGRLSRFHPSVLSVWGSDVMVVPNDSRILRKIVVKNLLYYDGICCTSKALVDSLSRICPELPFVHQIPIGVDTKYFCANHGMRTDKYITIGTVKKLMSIYGVDILLQAFARARHQLLFDNPKLGRILRLLIVGGGPQLAEMNSMARNLGINHVVEFAGPIQNHKVPRFLNRMDIFVAMSRSESFGVAVVEASACEIPVVVSNVGGLPEVVQDEVTGFIVRNEDIGACANTLVTLIRDRQLRQRLGTAGRRFVKEHYEWAHCGYLMHKVYDQVLGQDEK